MIIIAAAGFAVFGLMGAVTAYVIYDKATAPDRSAPDVVVSNYLRAYLVDRDEAQTNLYVCNGDAPGLEPMRALRAEAERREREFDVNVRVVWGALDRAATERGETVQTTLRIGGYSATDGTSRSSRQERWEFEVVEQDGWRVCGARELG
ncbi:hypothetical protein O7627_01870 [Solwaraspora sp. WMMD1047]|uniref:hypothetical protein n=1 Tax=Solwaraspora sp. WMMD1047 TaxID=3016102 RepID=UPI002417CB1D|nr:hypothetical protein [Solwaraspora sp. WMMD1047]MDG4828049.1 hypothetical protein [Solwaraspora sp. WMMD1047]